MCKCLNNNHNYDCKHGIKLTPRQFKEQSKAIENKASKSIIGDIVSNGILTPNRIDELFIQAIGDVLNEIEENKKGSK